MSTPGEHPVWKSDLPFGTGASCPTDVLHIASRLPSPSRPPQSYWVVNRMAIPTAITHFQQLGYDLTWFTPYTSRENWEKFYPDVALENDIIIARAPAPPISQPTFVLQPTPSRAALSSTSPATPATHAATTPVNLADQLGQTTPTHQSPAPSQNLTEAKKQALQLPLQSPQTQPPLQQPQQQQQLPSATDFMSLFHQMLQHQADQNAATALALAKLSSSKPIKAPTLTFPKWSGKREDVPLFLDRLAN